MIIEFRCYFQLFIKKENLHNFSEYVDYLFWLLISFLEILSEILLGEFFGQVRRRERMKNNSLEFGCCYVWASHNFIFEEIFISTKLKSALNCLPRLLSDFPTDNEKQPILHEAFKTWKAYPKKTRKTPKEPLLMLFREQLNFSCLILTKGKINFLKWETRW